MNTKRESKQIGWANIGLWALQIFLALAFLAAGSAKLSGQPMMVAVFDKVGVGQWFRYLTGGIEVISAVLLLIPRTTAFAAFTLAVTMTGAVLAHLLVLGGSPVAPAVLLVLALVIAWGRKTRRTKVLAGELQQA
ncbi:DoxX family protein [Pedosphaera parvula]|uniref:DoxX family protein n=1 Tax=Pedosphaera parvula (strain Ellin514) TaxID=320771 RepID=B9XFR9_PEDPL|nr:DoxX family protein [Pedosphaera parvula]EEF61433.1 DoxX family protein [Pedosphaera parvula Ellin514]